MGGRTIWPRRKATGTASSCTRKKKKKGTKVSVLGKSRLSMRRGGACEENLCCLRCRFPGPLSTIVRDPPSEVRTPFETIICSYYYTLCRPFTCWWAGRGDGPTLHRLPDQGSLRSASFHLGSTRWTVPFPDDHRQHLVGHLTRVTRRVSLLRVVESEAIWSDSQVNPSPRQI